MSPKPSSAEIQTNRYLQWLEHGMAPPVRGSLGKADEAAHYYFVRMRAARSLFGTPQKQWEGLKQLLTARHRFYAVLALVENQAQVSKRMKPDQVEQWRLLWDGKMDRFNDRLRLTLGPVLRRMKRKTQDFRLQRQITELLEQLTGHPVMEAKMRCQSNVQKNRERAYAVERQQLGGPVAEGAIPGLHRDYLRSAKEEAQKRGQKGYAFPMGSAQAEAASCQADHPELRRLLWWESSYAPVPSKAVERLRSLRHAYAQHEGHETFAAKQFHGAVAPNPRRINSALRQAQEVLMKDTRGFRQEALRYLNATGDYEPLENTPWDWCFAETQIRSNSYKDFRKIFPWRETSLKVFSELLEKTGWHALRPARVSGEGIWSTIHFHCQRDDGRQAHLIYTPFRPNENEHSYSDGQASTIISAWDPEGNASTPWVIWIDQCLDKKDKCFGPEELRVLCHEIGHALHYLSLPGYTPEETSFVPVDVFEIPSHLFELYPRDPAVLARWASKKGPAACRRSRHWQQGLKWEHDIALTHLQELRSAQVDLQIHMDMNLSFKDICADSMKRCGETMFEEDNSWRRQFIWDDYLACMDCSQTIPKSMVRRLVTVSDHGRVDSQVVLDTYLSLLNNVLADGISAERVRQSWSRWAGESFSSSLKTSVMTHARQSARITRRATQELRKKFKKVSKA